MATVVDTLITEYKLDASKYTSGAKDVVNATNSIGSAAGGFGDLGPLGNLAKGGALLGAAIVGVNSVLPFMVGLLEGLLPVISGVASGFGVLAGFLIAKPFLDAAAQMDSLKRGLASLVGGAENARAVFANLREVAKLPGLGLPEAIQGFNQLYAAMIPATTAINALKAFGNALALVGKGRAELSNVILALSQIAGKGIGGISGIGEEINQQLAENVPQIKAAMLQAFGTIDTEAIAKTGITGVAFIEKIVKELQKLPQATGGIQNAFENFSDSVLMGMAAIGDGIAKYLMPGLDKVASLISYLTESGALEQTASAIAKALGADKAEEAMPRFVALIVAVVEKMPDIINMAKNIFTAILEGGLALFRYMAQEISMQQRMIEDAIDAFMPGSPMKDNREMMEWAKSKGMIASPPDFNSIYELGKELGQNLADSIFGRAGEILQGAAGWNPKTPGIPGELDKDRLAGYGNAMQETARNTAEIVSIQKRQLQLQEGALGGGSVGRVGIAAREMVDIRRRSRPAMVPG